jgi:hypothetical protein
LLPSSGFLFSSPPPGCVLGIFAVSVASALISGPVVIDASNSYGTEDGPVGRHRVIVHIGVSMYAKRYKTLNKITKTNDEVF